MQSLGNLKQPPMTVEIVWGSQGPHGDWHTGVPEWTALRSNSDPGEGRSGKLVSEFDPMKIVLQLVLQWHWLQLACPCLWVPQGPQHHSPFPVLHTYSSDYRKLTLASPPLHQDATVSGRQRPSPLLLCVENYNSVRFLLPFFSFKQRSQHGMYWAHRGGGTVSEKPG